VGLFSKSKNKRTAQPKPVAPIVLSNGQQVDISAQVDCLGDSCPRPQLMTKKALNNCAAGDVIEILIDNPSSMEAIPPMLPELNATHLETIKGERRWEVYVRKD
jgi:tRNA 2-thiouridine synthesizing protein A